MSGCVELSPIEAVLRVQMMELVDGEDIGCSNKSGLNFLVG